MNDNMDDNMDDNMNVDIVDCVSSEDVYKLPSMITDYIEAGNNPIAEMVKPSSTINPFAE